MSASESKRVGFIGLGNMGGSFSARLVEQGWEVIGWNRAVDPIELEFIEQAKAAGVTVVDDPAEAVATGIVLSSLPNDAVVGAVFTPELLAAAPEGTVHANLATISAEGAERLATTHAAAGVGYVAAPVLGGIAIARAGKVAILASGSESDIERARPALADISRVIEYIGPHAGDGNSMKIAVNLLSMHAIQALSEAIVILERKGVDATRLVPIIADGPFPGPIYGVYGDMVARHEYEPVKFSMALARKDLGLAVEAAHSAGIPVPVADELVKIFDEALARGYANLDWSSVSEVTRNPSA